MGITRTGGQRTATSQPVEDGRKLSRLRNHYRGSTVLSNRALFWGAPLIGAALLSAVPAVGNPTGGSVVGGSATIAGDGTGNVTINQTTDRAILHWDDFSIDVGETTQFVQPGAGSIALNRVTGTAESILLGTLTANGNVWLVNPNGVFAGAGAVIDVNGFLGSTADILNSDFLDGNDRFSFNIPSANPDATVVNYGGISVGERGLAALVAPGVENDGIIVGRMAQVVLGGTPTFALDFTGDGLLSFEVGSQVAAAPDGMTELVTNSGQIDAPGGMVLLTASTVDGVVDNVINMSGVIQARSLTTANGQVVLSGGDSGVVRMAGTIDASGTDSGETGGTVKLLGESIALDLGALVDASGDAGGGTVLVGGNFQGNGPEQNATQSVVDADATIHADALNSGDGGTVIVWADGDTRFEGTVTARGGASGGDGGFVEVSGAETLSFAGAVDTRAPAGSVGTLLLDPTTLDVVSGVAGVGEIEDATLSGLLAANDVDLQTTVGGTGTGDGEITFVTGANVVWTSGNDLTVIAEDDAGLNIQNGTVSVEASVTINGTIGTGVDAANLDIQAGTVDLASDIFVDGAITGTATAVSVSPGASIQDGIDVAAALGATVTVNAGTYAESVTIAKPLDLDLSGTVQVTDLTASEAIGLGGTLNTDGGALLFSQDVTLTADTILDTDQTGAVAAGSVTYADIDSAAASAFSLSIDATGAVADGTVTLGGVGQSVALAAVSASGGTLTLNGGITTADGDVILRTGSDLTIASPIDTQPGLGVAVSTIDIAIDPGADPDATNPPELANTAAGTLNADAVTLTADAMDLAGAITATGAVTLAQSTLGRQINLAGEVSSRLSLTDAEINQIDDASILRIGNSDAGRINFSDDVTPGTNVTVVALISGADVVDSNNAGLIVEDLRITSAGVELDSGNHNVTNLAAEVTGDGNDFIYTDEIGGFTVASVDGVDGISTANATSDSGDITLSSDGTININQAIVTGSDTVTATDVGDAALTGSILVTSISGAIIGDGSGTVTTGAAEVGGNDAVAVADTATSGSITLSADGVIELAATNALATGNATVTDADLNDTATTGSIILSGDTVTDGAGGLVSVAMGTATGVPGAEVAGVLTATTDGTGGGVLDSAILVTSADDLTLGGLTTSGGTIVAESTGGDIDATGAIDAGAANVTLLALTGAVTQDPASTITAEGLAIAADSASLVDDVNDINVLAADIGGTNEAFRYTQTDGLQIGTVTDGLVPGGSVAGITTQGGQITVIADTGVLDLANGVTSNDGGISLAGEGVSQSSSSTVDAGTGTITIDADTGVIDMAGLLTTTSNDVATGAVRIVDGGLTTLGNISAVNGLVVLGDAGDGTLGAIGQSDLPTPATITASELAIASSGGITLDHDNEIGTLNAVTRGGDFTLNDSAGGLTIAGAVGDGTGTVDIDTAGGALVVSQSITATDNSVFLTGDGVNFGVDGDVSSGNGTIGVDGRAGQISTVAGTQLLSTGTIDLVADDMVFALGSVIGGDGVGGLAATVIASPSSSGAADDTIGLAGGVGTLQLDLTDLNTINATDVRIGDTTVTDGIDIGGQLTDGALAATFSPDDLTLASNGGITGAAAIDLESGAVSRDLILRAGGDVVLNNSGNDFADIAATLGAGSLTLNNADALTVSSATDDIGTVDGVTAVDGVQITSGGLLTVASVVDTTNATSGDIDLTANAGGIAINADVDSAGGNVDISALGLGGITSTASIEAADNVSLDTANGSVAVNGTVDALSGTVDIAVVGVGQTLSNTGTITGDGDVTLTTANGDLSIGGAVESTAGAVSVTANGAGRTLSNTAAITAQTDITLSATAGNVTIGGLVDSDGGAVDVTANGAAATLSNTAAIIANSNVTMSTTDGVVSIGEAVESQTGTVDITANGIGRTLTSTGAGTITGNGDVTLATADGDLSIGGAVDSTIGAVSVTSNGAGRTLSNTAAITAQTDITLSATAGNVTIGGLVDSDGGAVDVTANGAAATLSNTAAIIANGNVTMSTTDGVVSIGEAVESQTGTVDITANGIGRTLTSTGAGTITGNGDVTLATADGDLSIGGAVDSTVGAVSVTANGAGRTLSNTAAITAQTDITLSATAGNVTIGGLVDSDGGAVDVTANGAAATLSNTAAIIANGNVTMSTTDGVVSIGEAVESQTGTVDITANGIGRTLTSTGAGTITGDGDVTLATANGDVSIGGAVDSTAGAVSVTANGAGQTLSNTAAITAQTDITLSATAGNVTIGGLVDSDGGAVDVTANGAAATLSNTAAIIANGNVTMSTTDGVVSIGEAVESQTGTVDITANGIGRTLTSTGAGTITGNGDVTLATANGNLTIGGTVDSSAGNVDIQANGAGSTLTTNAAVTADDDVTLATASGNLAVNAAIEATNGSATATVGGVGNLLSLGTDGMVTAGDTVALTADEMSLGDPDPAGGNNSIAGTVVTLETTTAGRIIDLGEDPDISLTALHLSDTELDTVSADILRIGSADAGPIYVTDAITLDPASVPVLSLETNSAVLRWATNDGDTIAVAGLAIDANFFVLLDTQNDVDTLAVDTPSFLSFNDADGFDVVTVDTVSGLTSGSTMTLVSEGGAIDVANNIDVLSGSTMVIDTGVDGGSGDGGIFTTGTNSSVEATAGDVTVIADTVGLGGTLTASAAGASVTIANASADRAIGIGGAIAGLDLNLDELSRITADTVTIGSTNAGSMVIAGLDPASTDTFNTLELITGEGMQFNGDLNGSFNLTMTAGGDIDFGDLADPNSTVSFGTEAVPLGVMTFTTPGSVELGGSALAGVQYFAEEFVINIGGSFVSGQLNPSATTFQPVNLERLTVLGAGSVTLFGSIAGDATQTAASQGPPAVNTPNGKDADWLFNGCVLNTLTCFNVPLILPISGLDLSLEEERLLREPFEEEEEELEDLLSNTGNEELW